MVGPNPHRFNSFGELRAINGCAWIVCRSCRRYVIVPAHALKDRDTRETTFSCSVCGDRGELVLEDPYKEGLQPDPRPQARHHPDAIVRLRAFATLAATSDRERHKPSRESLPQANPRPRPKPAPEPRYVLKPFPCQSFGDLEAWGLSGRIHCLSCHRRCPLEVGDNLRTRPLLQTRLRCTGTLRWGTPCNNHGMLYLSPIANGGRVPDEPFVSVCCYNPDHTGIDAGWLVLSRPPWQGLLGKDQNFSCPGCRRGMRHIWHQSGHRIR